jgi:hypothetical protein
LDGFEGVVGFTGDLVEGAFFDVKLVNDESLVVRPGKVALSSG